jgi:predicted glycosyltransferase
MKILVYLGHPAHFHNYKISIKEWQSNGNEVFILIKKKDVLEELLLSEEFRFWNILSEGRSDTKMGIFLGTLKRTLALFTFCVKHKPDILTGTSVENSFVGAILRIPVVNINEDDAAVVPLYAKLSYPLANVILNPNVCNSGKWNKKAIKYNSLHELAYLHPDHFSPNRSIVDKYFDSNKNYFLIRFAKLTAHHDIGKTGISNDIAQQIIDILQPLGEVYITSERQLEKQFEPFRINIAPKDIHHIMAFTKLFIGDSQTMAAEAGVLGIPFIRFNDFVGQIGYLNELELSYKLGVGIKTSEIEKIYSTIQKLAKQSDIYEENRIRQMKLLNDKFNFQKFLSWFISTYPVSYKVIKKNSNYLSFFENKLYEKKVFDFKLNSEDSNLSVINAAISNNDFTLNQYRLLLQSSKVMGYKFFTFEEWCSGKAEGKYIIMRHDVDLMAERSLDTAIVENELGIKSTYYFRVVPQSNQPNIIKEIVRLGHEVGYHYEDLSITKGDIDKAIVLFKENLEYFRQFYPVKTISMHGSPSSKWDNRDVWKKYHYVDFGVIGEPYFDLLAPNLKLERRVVYFTDTGRMWNGDKYNVRDKPKQISQRDDLNQIHTTSDLINWLDGAKREKIIMITTHPQRWTNSLLGWTKELIAQSIKNRIKGNFYVKDTDDMSL